MIVTCTMNPSLDYYMEANAPIVAGSTNRSVMEYYEAGGKGINVSIVLNNLQVPSRATGFVGGFNKDFYITLLEKYSYIQPNFTYTHGHTRINVKYIGNGTETELNAMGPTITNEDMENLMMKTNRLDVGDYFVLGGSCPHYLNDHILAMLERLMNDRVRVCLDVNRRVSDPVMPFHPFLIKTRDTYENERLGRDLSMEEIIAEMKKLVDAGAENVISTVKGGTEAYLVNKDAVYHGVITHHDKAVSMIGTGDALVAGFIMNTQRGNSVLESFRFGCCCSTATAYSKGFGVMEEINALYDQAVVEKIG